MKTTVQVTIFVLLSLEKSMIIGYENGPRIESTAAGHPLTFSEILRKENNTFVDKTLLLEDIFDPVFNRHILLITMPKRFGKSFNLRMIEKFCEIEMIVNGTPVAQDLNNIHDTSNYRMFTDRYPFGNLKIAQKEEFIREHLGKYPVVYLDFQQAALKVNSFQRAVIYCAVTIRNAFLKHAYLIESPRLTEDEKNIIKIWKTWNCDFREEFVEQGIKHLLQFLYQHFRRQVIVLVDEFDILIHSAIGNGVSEKELREILNFYKTIFLIGLKDMAQLRVAVLTGIVHIADYGMSSSIPEFQLFAFARNEKFAQHYGFSLEEVQELFNRTGNRFENLSFDELSKFYDGYTVFDKQLYSPYSIIQCLHEKRIKPFWNEVGTIVYIWPALRLFTIRFKVFDLYDGKSLDMPVMYKNSLNDIISLRNCISMKRIRRGNTREINTILNFLLDSGYVRINSQNSTHFNIKVANEETRLDLKELLKEYQNYAISDEDAELAVDIAQKLEKVTKDEFETSVQHITNKLDQLGKLILPNKPNIKEDDLKNIIRNIIFISDWNFHSEARLSKPENTIPTQYYVTKTLNTFPSPRKPRTTKKPEETKGDYVYADFILPGLAENLIIFEMKYGPRESSNTALNQIEKKYAFGLSSPGEYHNKTYPYNLLMIGLHLVEKENVPCITISARIMEVINTNEFGESKTIHCEPITDDHTTEISITRMSSRIIMSPLLTNVVAYSFTSTMSTTESLVPPTLPLLYSAATPFDFNDKFIKSSLFIDKSELFVELFRHRCNEPAFLTFPPKFGKSTNLQMLKKLIQFELDFNDQPKPMETTSAYLLLQNLKLAKQKDVYSKHLAQHPVILLDLKYDVEGEINHYKLVDGLTLKIKQIFEEYEWLGKKLQNNDHPRSDFFQNALRGKLSLTELPDSLFVLCEVLYEYFNESKVVFLVDDFDYVSKYDYTEHYVTDPLYSIIYFMILKAAKAPYCHTCSLILSVSNRKVGDQLHKNIRQFPFLEKNAYTPFFGILETELDELFERYRCSEIEKSDVKKWYGGYQTDRVYMPIYNTYSIMEYFRNRNKPDALKPYWSSVQNTTFIMKFLRVSWFRTYFNELLQYGVIRCTIEKRRLLADKKFFPYAYITDDKKDIRIGLDKLSDLVGLLFEHGYLGHWNYIEEGSYKIPNWEIEYLLTNLAIKFYQDLDIPVAKLSTDLKSMLYETDNSTILSLAGALEWSLFSIVSPVQKAGFLTTELEHFSVIHLAAAYIKITEPGTEVIASLMTCPPRNDIIIISKGQAMMINFDRKQNRLLPTDEYMCKSIKDRNITKIRLLGVTLNDEKAKCVVHSVDCTYNVEDS